MPHIHSLKHLASISEENRQIKIYKITYIVIYICESLTFHIST